MIEYYIFKHKGGQPKYEDAIVSVPNPELSMGLIASEKLGENAQSSKKIFSEIMRSEFITKEVHEIASEVDKHINDKAEYMIFRITDTTIDSMRKGGVYGKIVKNGELKVLPNGILHLEDEDRIICATEEFFSFLEDEEILVDSLFAESCQEWMSYMVRRISDINWLSGKNLSAVTLIVRSSE